VWSGSIQSAPNQPAAGASGALAASAGAPQGASQPRAQVSSLQQLLALKNRVLMELQKHGIGKPQTASGVAAANGQPAAGAGASGAASVPATAARPPVASVSPQQPAASTLTSKQEYVGAAALIGALLAAVVAGLAMRRRKRNDASTVHARSGSGLSAPDDGAQSAEPAASNEAARSAANAYDQMAKSGASAASHEPLSPSVDADDVPPLTERVSPPAESGVVSTPHGAAANAQPSAADVDTRAAAAAAAATAGMAAAAALDAVAARDHQSDPTHEPQAFDQHDAHGGDQASVVESPAAPSDEIAHEEPSIDETEAEAQSVEPLTSTEPTEPTPELPPDVATPATHAEHAAADEDIDSIPILAEPISAEPTATAATDAAQAESHTEQPLGEPQLSPDRDAHEPATEALAAAAEPTSAEPTAAAPAAAAPDEPHAAPQFPHAALAALGSLDMSLPPRAAESAEPSDPAKPAEPVTQPASLTTQPVVEPDITAQQAVPLHEPQPPRVGEQIEAGTAGHGAIAGMGAAKYGPLALDFDLELPPGPAQPLPTFTPEELARIARNKLELAAEYIELGDVAGARTLINEVIESNDAATRNEARAMLSTLAPLS
jgi:pilus assembly protein FimV